MANYNNSAQMGIDFILKFLRERMEEKEITNYRLEKMTGISRVTIARYFSKETDMNLTNFLKICGALELRPYLIPAEMDENDMQQIYFN